MNQRAECVGKASLHSKAIIRTHTQPADCSIWTTKMIAKNKNDDKNIDHHKT